MTGPQILGNLQQDVDGKKQKFLELLRNFHELQPLDNESQVIVEKARVEWLISINHLKTLLPFLQTNELVNTILPSEIKKKRS